MEKQNLDTLDKAKWVVGIDRWYYPEVEYFDDEEEAKSFYNELLKEHEDDAPFDSIVFFGKLEIAKQIQTVR